MNSASNSHLSENARLSRKKIKQALLNNMHEFDANNLEQINAVNLLAEGNYLFITGEGGTGKSWFISKLSKICHQNNINFRIVTPTGITAINLNESLVNNNVIPVASTYHSLYGFIPNRNDRVLHRNMKNEIKELDLVIVDEAPMIDALSLDRISFKHKYPHKDTADIENKLKSGMFDKSSMFTDPFGDTLVVMFGDLFQLPPIVKQDLTKYGYKSKYIFDSETFKAKDFKTVSLYKNYRVTEFNDEINKRKSQILKKLLKELRYNCLSPESMKALSMFNQKRVIDNGKIIDKLLIDDFILLSPYNRECYNINTQVKNRLKGNYTHITPLLSYKVTNDLKKSSDVEKNNYLTKRFDTPYTMSLKLGQKVIITSNDNNKGYYNGDMGVISEIVKYQGEVKHIKVTVNRLGEPYTYTIERKLYVKPSATEIMFLRSLRFSGNSEETDKKIKENVKYWIEQFPIKDGYAITNHRSQGKTFHKTIINPDGFGECMFYVSLSRNTNLDGILLTQQILKKHVKVDDYVLKFYLDNNLIEDYMVEPIKKKLKL